MILFISKLFQSFLPVVAPSADGTFRAFGVARQTDGLAVSDKEFVDLEPVLFWNRFEKHLFGFFRGFGIDQADAVGDAVNMNVNGNGWFAEGIT